MLPLSLRCLASWIFVSFRREPWRFSSKMGIQNYRANRSTKVFLFPFCNSARMQWFMLIIYKILVHLSTESLPSTYAVFFNSVLGEYFYSLGPFNVLNGALFLFYDWTIFYLITAFIFIIVNMLEISTEWWYKIKIKRHQQIHFFVIKHI